VRGLFFVQSECLESNYIASRAFRVNVESFGFELVRVLEMIFR
jgi:3-dehydroquinate synthase class II